MDPAVGAVVTFKDGSQQFYEFYEDLCDTLNSLRAAGIAVHVKSVDGQLRTYRSGRRRRFKHYHSEAAA